MAKDENPKLIAEARAFWPDPTKPAWPGVDELEIDLYLSTEERAYASIHEVTAEERVRMIYAAIYARGLIGRLAFALDKADKRIRELEAALPAAAE